MYGWRAGNRDDQDTAETVTMLERMERMTSVALLYPDMAMLEEMCDWSVSGEDWRVVEQQCSHLVTQLAQVRYDTLHNVERETGAALTIARGHTEDNCMSSRNWFHCHGQQH